MIAWTLLLTCYQYFSVETAYLSYLPPCELPTYWWNLYLKNCLITCFEGGGRGIDHQTHVKHLWQNTFSDEWCNWNMKNKQHIHFIELFWSAAFVLRYFFHIFPHSISKEKVSIIIIYTYNIKFSSCQFKGICFPEFHPRFLDEIPDFVIRFKTFKGKS